MRNHVLVTGGAGFIGANLADRLARDGHRVVILDNLSRSGVMRNVRWLEARHPGQIELCAADVRDAQAVVRAMRGARHVFHFAVQAAITTSLLAPREDFEINIGGTLNVLEAMRAVAPEASLLFTSTHEVYGRLDDLAMRDIGLRCEPALPDLRARGVDEDRPLDLQSPYGCSKGTAERYVLDYARIFGLNAAVFRMSCIYGPRQLGTEDQGFVAHCFRAAMRGEPLLIHGDGRQVRDLLDVGDLVDAMVLAQAHIDRLQGKPFNIGGGPANTVSWLELVESIALLLGQEPLLERTESRTGIQRWYVSDTSRFGEATGWSPRIGVADGLHRLLEWLLELEARQPHLEVAQ
jgi:CDP-paratose 2-epimerase